MLVGAPRGVPAHGTAEQVRTPGAGSDGVRGSRREATAAFPGGALFELLIWSLEARPTPPVEEADALFHELSRPLLAAAVRAGRVAT
jgi:hypothetical protein